MYNIQPGVLLLLLLLLLAAGGAAAGAATAGRETNFKKAPREHRRRILPTLSVVRSVCWKERRQRSPPMRRRALGKGGGSGTEG